MTILLPTNAFVSVDFPAFGRPTKQAKPDRKFDTGPSVADLSAMFPMQQDSPPPQVTRHHYGWDPAQYGELYIPGGDQRRQGTIIVIHGGAWRAEFTAAMGQPISWDLATRGWAVWNLEYRRVGYGVGWFDTFFDIATGIDMLTTFAAVLDLSQVVAVGHSAGGQLAMWAAARPQMPDGVIGANPKVSLTGVVSQAGVLNLRQVADDFLSGAGVRDFLGGPPEEMPELYDYADPFNYLPLPIPVICLHSRDDELVPFSQSESYVSAAVAAGGDVRLVEIPGWHNDPINPASSAWTASLGAIDELVDD
jgi:acetyl esterase/lipase